MFAFALSGIIGVQAQNDTVLNVTQILEGNHLVDVCKNKYDRIVIYAAENCSNFSWWTDSGTVQHFENPLVLDQNGNYHYGGVYEFGGVTYIGCGINSGFTIRWYNTAVPAETTTELWKHQREIIELSLDTLPSPTIEVEDYYDYLWSTGEATTAIEIVEPGTYTCDISDMCGTATRTFIVKDNVELYRATVDLTSGLNKVTWQTTPAQAEYISEVKVERDGMVVGTVPYEDGQFLDNIGSENASRNYRLTGITTEGDECPIPSYQLGTLHVDFSPNASNPNKLNMAWTAPYIEEGSPLEVIYFQICKYDPVTGEVTVVDQLGANNTIGSYNISLFDGGYATVAALFSDGRAYEDLSFSNLTEDILGVGENEGRQFKVYPNPANGRMTIEATGNLIVTNIIGQTILTKEIDGKETMELPQGLYFVKLGNKTQKIVVE